MSRLKTIDAERLQHDVCLMTLNLSVLVRAMSSGDGVEAPGIVGGMS